VAEEEREGLTDGYLREAEEQLPRAGSLSIGSLKRS
jgi:hypothetical protein